MAIVAHLMSVHFFIFNFFGTIRWIRRGCGVVGVAVASLFQPHSARNCPIGVISFTFPHSLHYLCRDGIIENAHAIRNAKRLCLAMVQAIHACERSTTSLTKFSSVRAQTRLLATWRWTLGHSRCSLVRLPPLSASVQSTRAHFSQHVQHSLVHSQNACLRLMLILFRLQ